MDSQVATDLRNFITANFLFGDTSRLPADGDSMLETGILDSTGVLELIEFLEDHYEFEVADTEAIPENLDSVAGLTRYVLAKTGQAA